MPFHVSHTNSRHITRNQPIDNGAYVTPAIYIKTTSRMILVLTCLTVLTLITSFYALAAGSIELSLSTLWHSLFHNSDSFSQTVLWDIRMPRLIAAFVTGGALALAGALMQVLLRNPLADPYVLGVSGGAAVAALLVISLGLGGAWISTGAFIGALSSVVLVFTIAKIHGDWSTSRLLLTGIIVAAGWGSVISFLLTLGNSDTIWTMLFWLMGDLSNAKTSYGSGIILVITLLVAMAFSHSLNILAHGELQASALGVSVRTLRISIYFAASLLTATAVTIAGSVGFVGLVVPHIIRLAIGSDHRLMLPSSVLLGGNLLLLADTVARTAWSPQQLPVGILTAFIGVPLLLFLLYREKGRGLQVS